MTAHTGPTPDPTTTPTGTEPHHDVRDERARDVAWNGWIDDHRDHGSVTRELMAAFDAGWAAAVAARPAPTVSAVDPRHPAPVVSDGTDVRDLADRIETAMTDDGHRMPRTDETRYLAHVAAQTALAVVGQGVTAETAWDEGPLQVEYGLVWDDRGSADTFPTLEQARAVARELDEPVQVVRIETWPVADEEGQE